MLSHSASLRFLGRSEPIRVSLHHVCIDLLLRATDTREPVGIAYDAALALHRRYPPHDAYGYDPEAKRTRASERFDHIGRLLDLRAITRVAELGGGDGQLALRFLQNGAEVDILDAQDWRDEDVAKAPIAFHRVHERSSYPLADRSVDLFLSYNTFEHLPDPAAALAEMLRITRPGGHIFLYFSPLYNSPWGLHAYRTFFAPWPQFLLDHPALRRFVQATGIFDLGAQRQTFQYVNGWSSRQYETLFASVVDRSHIRAFWKGRTYEHMPLVYRHLKCFWGRQLSFDELTTESIEILLRVN